MQKAKKKTKIANLSFFFRSSSGPIWVTMYSRTVPLSHLAHQPSWPPQLRGDDPHGTAAADCCSGVSTHCKLSVPLGTCEGGVVPAPISSESGSCSHGIQHWGVRYEFLSKSVLKFSIMRFGRPASKLSPALNESSELHQMVLLQNQRGCHTIFCRPGPRRMSVIWMNCYCGITLCFDIIGFKVIMDASYQLSSRQNLWGIPGY